MQRDFDGGVYWDNVAEKCSNISRAVEIQGVADFEEIWHSVEVSPVTLRLWVRVQLKYLR